MNTPSILESPKSLVITSRQLVMIINTLRKDEGIEAELAHSDFLKKINNEFEEEINEGNISSVQYKDNKGEMRKQYELSKNQAIQLLMGESRKVRKKVIEYIEQLENQLKEQNKFKVPQTFKEALLLAVEQQEVIEQQQLTIENQEGTIDNLYTALDSLLEWVSIIKVAKRNGVSEKAFNWRRLKAQSENMGFVIKKAASPRFGYQNLYHINVFKSCYPEYKYNLLDD